jgi:hypothetical protein
MAERRPHRIASAAICDAVRTLPGDARAFAEELEFAEAGGLLGDLGTDLTYSDGPLAELRIGRRLRLADPEEIAEIVRDLDPVAEEPWPAIRTALKRFITQPRKEPHA